MALARGDTGSRIDDEVRQAAAAMGLVIEADQQQSDGLEAWPENEPVIRVFMVMSTQWNVGLRGPIGLRYEALPVVMDLLGIAAEARAELFPGLRVMEAAVLEDVPHGG